MGTLQKNLLLGHWSHNIQETIPRSPKDSPVIEKKRLKRLTNGWMSRRHSSAVVESHKQEPSEDSTMRLKHLNKVMMSRRYSAVESQKSEDSDDSDSGSGPKSILKRVTRLSSDERHVQFDSDTYVQHIDEEGQKTTGTESLCIEPKDRKAFMTRNLMRISQANQENSMTSDLGQVFTYQNSNSEGTHEVHVFFIPDKEGGTKLKMLVKVGSQFLPDEICVKANMSGNKIRVMATKVVENENGSKKSEPFNERFLLPTEVDPYSVEARLDNKGNLTIEAPLMTHARKSDIAKEQAESHTKSL